MIRLPHPVIPLSGVERYGLELLVDLSRLVPADREFGDIVRLQILEQGPENAGLLGCMSHDWYLERSDGVVGIPRTVLGLVGSVAGGVAEQRSKERDRHDRVPASE